MYLWFETSVGNRKSFSVRRLLWCGRQAVLSQCSRKFWKNNQTRPLFKEISSFEATGLSKIPWQKFCGWCELRLRLNTFQKPSRYVVKFTSQKRKKSDNSVVELRDSPLQVFLKIMFRDEVFATPYMVTWMEITHNSRRSTFAQVCFTVRFACLRKQSKKMRILLKGIHSTTVNWKGFVHVTNVVWRNNLPIKKQTIPASTSVSAVLDVPVDAKNMTSFHSLLQKKWDGRTREQKQGGPVAAKRNYDNGSCLWRS